MIRMPEIVGDTWFNSRKLVPRDLEGKIILVDFWTYSCVNCARTLPYLKEWWKRYKDYQFLIIGVHAPEFEFEKEPENVYRAIKDLGVIWPVVLDNDHTNWNNFANRYWPAKYLIAGGEIIYTHFGEGGYEETEAAIQAAIKNRLGHVIPPPLVSYASKNKGAVCFIPTPELYLGYFRGRPSNSGGYIEDAETEYRPPKHQRDDSTALAGKFFVAAEYVESREKEASVILRFRATEANLVLSGQDGKSKVQVLLNGEPLPDHLRGRDADKAGEIRITAAKMYNLLKHTDMVEGTLSVTAKEGNFRAYAFTFSGCL